MNYTFSYTVNLDDLDFMNHVGHAKWLVILMHARVDMLQQAGLPFDEMLVNKAATVVAEINIKYLRPAFFMDQLTIQMTPHSPFNKGFIIGYEVRNPQDKICVTADIKLVFVDETGKSTLMPEHIKQRFFPEL